MKNAMLLSVLCAAVLTRCDVWNKPLVDPIKEKVDELTSIKSIVVTKYPKKNAFQEGVDVDPIPQNAEDWAGEDYGLEISGINGMDEARVLVPGLEYVVEEIVPGDDKSSLIFTVPVVLTDSHRYGKITTEFKITILPSDVKNYTIVAYDGGNGNSVVAVPSGFTTLDAGEEVAVYIYTTDGWSLKSGTSPAYGFVSPRPTDGTDYQDINGPPFKPFKLPIDKTLISRIPDNKIYLWADFTQPDLMLTDSDGTRYYEGEDALSTAIGSASAGGTIAVMKNIKAGSEAILINRNITLQAYDKAAASVTVYRAGGTGSLFTISGGTLTLTGGAGTRSLVIDGGYDKDKDQGKVHEALIMVTGGLLNMRSGVTLQNNYNEKGTGGGVCVVGGSFTMAGGMITGNSSIEDLGNGGGGVYVSSGVFTMSGGMIDGNTGKPFGGGVQINSSGGKVDFTGGEIRGNTVPYGRGGGIHVSGGSLTMSGSALIGSNSVENGGGGGVAISNKGYFGMADGEIRGNFTKHGWIAGGGVILFDDNNNATPSFNMSGGKITGNESYELDAPHGPLPGAGVFFHNGTFSMSGSALITEDNDLYLRSNGDTNDKKITISGALTRAPPVARITLKTYVAGTAALSGDIWLVNVASGSFSLTEPGWTIVGGTLTK
jgi:hypothetical protein